MNKTTTTTTTTTTNENTGSCSTYLSTHCVLVQSMCNPKPSPSLSLSQPCQRAASRVGKLPPPLGVLFLSYLPNKAKTQPLLDSPLPSSPPLPVPPLPRSTFLKPIGDSRCVQIKTKKLPNFASYPAFTLSLSPSHSLSFSLTLAKTWLFPVLETGWRVIARKLHSPLSRSGALFLIRPPCMYCTARWWQWHLRPTNQRTREVWPPHQDRCEHQKRSHRKCSASPLSRSARTAGAAPCAMHPIVHSLAHTHTSARVPRSALTHRQPGGRFR